MYGSMQSHLESELEQITAAGLFKSERVIAGAQDVEITLTDGSKVLNFCANNYLGLAANKEIQNAAKETIDSHGFGLASVRFICGTQDIHKKLEREISDFLGTEDTILYAAAFDANGGLFEPLFDSRDAIVSDSLNHASLIDGIRLCKAERFRYKNNDMIDLEKQLKLTKNFRSRVIVTDGVFSMDGTIAQLDNIYKLAKKYNSLIFVDDCHATGFIGNNGRGSHEYNDVLGKIDIITGTLGKALGGGSGGFSSGKKEIIELLRQKSRPYLFSNTLAPSIVGASIKALEIIKKDNSLIKKLKENTIYFREKISKIGFEIKGKNHPIVPIMIYDDIKAKKIADYLYENDIYVVSFSYPVVPKGLSRIRIQISSAHTKIEMDKALKLLKEAGLKFGVLN